MVKRVSQLPALNLQAKTVDEKQWGILSLQHGYATQAKRYKIPNFQLLGKGHWI